MSEQQESKTYTYSHSPHIKSKRTTRWIMCQVIIALLPACIMGIVYFGLNAFLILLLSVLSANVSEIIFLLISGKNIKEIIKKLDGTSTITGLLVGMTIGTNYPLYAPVLGSAFAIIVVKMLFGGTGKNLVNPAIVGRIFIFMSFQGVIGEWLFPSISSLNGTVATTGATVLESLLKDGAFPSLSNWDLLLGTGLQGCIGETCKVAILVGAIYLAIIRVIDIRFPLIFICVTGLFSVVLNGFDFQYFLPSILSGGLILGAFFMATDYTTTPNTFWGNVVYFSLLGLLTAGLRQATKMEVVSFAILLMNLMLPFIDKFILNRPFGKSKTKKEKNQ